MFRDVGKAERALERIAKAMSCKPDDYGAIVDAVKLMACQHDAIIADLKDYVSVGRERDEARAAIEMWQREVGGRDADIDRLTRERDEARAALRELRDWLRGLRRWLADGAAILRVEDDLGDIDAMLARLNAVLGGR